MNVINLVTINIIESIAIIMLEKQQVFSIGKKLLNKSINNNDIYHLRYVVQIVPNV